MRTRFAPSPTGPLHLGHAFSALLAHDMARSHGGAFLLRIEDIDLSRARFEWEQGIYHDLTWLGIRWDAPPVRQSDRMPAYDAALDALWDKGVLYPCRCTRRDIAEALAAPQEGARATTGPDGPVYPGTCRPGEAPLGSHAPRPTDVPLRLDMRRGLAALGVDAVDWTEHGDGSATCVHHRSATARDLIDDVGDVVLARRDMGTSYHLSVVVDDAAQEITDVVRGRDLSEATAIHVVLQGLLKAPVPAYHHHRLIRDESGRRLAKRDDARAIRLFRAEGASPADIRRMVGLGPAIGETAG